MIRVYFDWNVFSNLKKAKYTKLREKLKEFNYAFLFPYSPAHFKDLLKSYNKDSSSNDLFFKDLETLEEFSKNHLIRWEGKRTQPLLATPSEYFKGIKNNEEISLDIEKALNDMDEINQEFGIPKFGNLLRSLYKLQPLGFEVNEENKAILKKMFPNINSNSTMWDFMKEIGPFSNQLLNDREYFRDFKKTIKEQGLKLDINSGNWDEKKVIERIDRFLAKFDSKLTFIEYVQTTFKHRKTHTNRYEFFTASYLLLDMIGYKSDKLPKRTDNMQNITADAEHAFYGAHCDFFVAIDKKLLTKAKVLYNEFNIPTIICTPEEFLENVDKVVHKFPQNAKDLIVEGIKLINIKNTVEFHPKSKDFEVDSYGIKLPKFYFNFFNYVIYQEYKEFNSVVLTFRRVFKNYSDFLFYSEIEQLIEDLGNVFGIKDQTEFQKVKKDFVYNNEENIIIWPIDFGFLVLEKDVELGRANLKYFIRKNNSG